MYHSGLKYSIGCDTGKLSATHAQQMMQAQMSQVRYTEVCQQYPTSEMQKALREALHRNIFSPAPVPRKIGNPVLIFDQIIYRYGYRSICEHKPNNLTEEE